ncbi:MAG: GntR family transcriptional regulator [Clostridia bacterium]|nr:GntR family transcriptional regulator [Clostridia bacterium]
MSTNFTVAEDIYNKIEELILSGNLKKGDIISENMFSNMFSVSRTPVREAIKRLEQDNLVGYDTHKNLKVLGVSSKDIIDIYDIRLKLEPYAVSLAVENATNEDALALVELIELQYYYANHGKIEEVKKIDGEFHAKLFTLSGSKIYGEILTTLHRKLKRYRKGSFERENRLLSALDEHMQIAKAFVEKDVEKAVLGIKTHIENARDNVLQLDIIK